MSKSSVKHCRFRMTFWTKSDKMATCRFGVENITFWTTSPVSVFRTYYQFLAKKASSKALFFLSQINMCPFCHFGSEKPIKNVGVRNTFQHVIILWFSFKKMLSQSMYFLSQIDFAKNENSTFWQSRFETGKHRGWSITFWTKSHQTAPCRKVV